MGSRAMQSSEVSTGPRFPRASPNIFSEVHAEISPDHDMCSFFELGR